MEMTPSTTPAKRTRAKPTTPSQEATVVVKTKKPRAPRKAAAVSVETPAAAPATAVTEDLAGLIATTAYFLAAERNFAPGRELDDWLEAERRVLARQG
jgi:hypothetical protein